MVTHIHAKAFAGTQGGGGGGGGGGDDILKNGSGFLYILMFLFLLKTIGVNDPLLS